MRPDLQRAYGEILQAHLQGAGEAASLDAYEFARRCLREGLAPDDVVAFHLEAVADRPGEEAARAQGLLLDVVMAFSLAYQQAVKELERANDELGHLSRFKTRMLSMVAHDMMNHVVATRMVATVMKREATAWPHLLPRLDNILQIVDDQEELIQNLLDLGRIESGRIQLDMEELDLNRLVERAAVKAAQGSTRHGVHVSGPPVKVQGDRGKLQQILDNLLGNAVKYSPQGGTVDVRLVPSGDRVTLEVQDSGVGIAPEDLPHVFEPFYRGLAAKTDIRGTGLGLSIVQSLVRMHGGTLEVDSQPGCGSTFRATFPAVVAVESR